MNEERIKEILSKVKKTVGENNYKLALAITGHRPGKIRDVSMSSKDGELLLDYITNLQQENQQLKEQKENLQNIVCNKIMVDYDIETPLKDELSKQIAKNIVLEESKNITEHIIDELEKWLEEEIKHYKEHFEFLCKSPSPVPVDDTKIILEKDDLIVQKLESTLNKLQELKGNK